MEKAKKEVAVATLNSKIYFGLVERLKKEEYEEYRVYCQKT